MPREGITREQVFQACAGLSGQGQKPTTRSVRAALGNTGSPNNIAAWIRQWRETQPPPGAPAPAVALAVPERVRQAMDEAAARVWSVAQELIEAEVRSARQACEQRVAAAEQERDDAAGTAEDLNEQIEALEQRMAELQGIAEDRARALEATRLESATLSERAQILEQQLAFERARGERLEARLTELAQALERPAAGGKTPPGTAGKKRRAREKPPKQGA